MKERGALEIGQAGVVDAAAWWTFDDQQIAESQSIGDETGNGNTLFVEGTRVTPVPGTLGGAFEFAPGQGNLRLLDPKKLAMGAGDYAVSLWIKRTASTAMAGRIFDFGGGTRGEWEHWGQPVNEAASAGLTISSGDYGVDALFRNGTRSYLVKAAGLSLPDQWHHVVVNVARDRTVTLWIDGERRDSVPISESAERDIQPSETLFIAKSGSVDHPNLHWSGAVDQLRVYRRALSNEEIKALFGENVSPRE
ncbi:MAG: LamG domain-containing protein [Chthoniobacterales bacterium]